MRFILTIPVLLFCSVVAFAANYAGFKSIEKNMIFIAGGTFEMGDTFGDSGPYSDEQPVHTVTLNSFYMGKYCVTFIEFDAFCRETGRLKPKDEGCGRGRRPVIHVSWYDAVEYCNWLSKKSRLITFYNIDGTDVTENRDANGYRLPTEAEWEYAAREGGKKVRFGNGKDTAKPEEINFDANVNNKKSYSETGLSRDRTTPAGTFAPNALGLYDMAGNVFQWCNDWYDKDYYSISPSENPKGINLSPERFVKQDPNVHEMYRPANGYRVVRGGFFGSNPIWIRASVRQWLDPYWGHNIHYVRSFRLCRSVGEGDK